jgi:hypothetical protein
VLSRSPFAAITDADAELRQLANIRIATGLLCLARTAPTVWASRYYFEVGAWGVPDVTLAGVVTLLLICFVTAGVLTPVSTMALIYTTRLYEAQASSESLATEILSLLLSLLVVASAGAHRSVDAILMRQPGWIGAPVRALYRLAGVPSDRGIRTILLLYFIALSLINLGGVVNHWYDDDWRGGRALQIIFSSSYMSRVWSLWRPFETYSPAAAAWTSWALTLTQLVMQTSMLALVWWRPTARLLIVWGAAFFVSSIVALQLHYLGAFELLIWIALFHRPRPSIVAVDQSFTRRKWSERTLLGAAATVLAVFVAHETWAYAGVNGLDAYPFPRLRLYIDLVGIHSPRVFNRNDLPLGDAWTVVYRNNWERLPYHGPSGERLAWLQFNDLLLYRSSIRWRNEFRMETFFDPDHDGVGRLQQLVEFDHRRRHTSASTYTVDYYIAPASHLELPPAARFERRQIGVTQFSCSGEANAVHCAVTSSIRLPDALTETQSDSDHRP